MITPIVSSNTTESTEVVLNKLLLSGNLTLPECKTHTGSLWLPPSAILTAEAPAPSASLFIVAPEPKVEVIEKPSSPAILSSNFKDGKDTDYDEIIEQPELRIPSSELMELCAADDELFQTEFFPTTVRQAPAFFHQKMWQMLQSSARQINIQIFRGGAKTTGLRLFTAKRVAYGLSRTIMYVGLSQDKAVQSLTWLRKRIEHNKKFREVFKLSKGTKWTDVEFEIYHELLDITITVLAYGVTGSIRGVNIDDYRPDLIVCDDILNEENTATVDQRIKMNGLIYGALYGSLAPRSDSPDAKMVMLQTPLNREDASTKALDDPSWLSAKFSCWSESTKDLADDEKESIWPERFPTQELRDLKASYLARNEASVWYREFEVKTISPETSSFKADWLNFYDLTPPREELCVIGAIDPVPPPTDQQLAKGLVGKDYEVLCIVGTKDGKDYYLLDYVANRGHEPNWTISEFFRLSLKWQPSTWVVEMVAYQRVLEWILRKAMKDKGIYFPIHGLEDYRKKFTRIVDNLAGVSSNGAFYVHKSHTDFIQQFNEYPDVTHDDILDAVSMAMGKMSVFGINPPSEVYGIPQVVTNPKSDVNYGYGAP